VRTVELFVDAAAQMEKAAEFDMEQGIVMQLDEQEKGLAHAAAKAEKGVASKVALGLRTLRSKARKQMLHAVRQQIRHFETSVDTMVEETIGGKDKFMEKSRLLGMSVSSKLESTLQRVMAHTIQGESALERTAFVAKAFKKILQCFKANLSAFEKLHGKQHIPENTIARLKHLMTSDEDGDFGDRDQTIETKMSEILPDPEKYGVPPYAGDMKKRHHYEEYIKRMLIVDFYQQHKQQIISTMKRHSEGAISAAQALMAIVGFTSKAWVPTIWMSYKAVEQGDWSYSGWAYL